MTLPLTGTASVTNGSTTVVVSGFAMSKLNVIPGTTVYIVKVPYFVAALTDSETFELDEPYAGASNAAVPLKVNQIDAAKAATVTLNSAIATYSARLALLDADGKGLFYTSLGVTGANDPGPGKLARDNADWALTTALYFDVIDAGNRPASGAIDLWAPATVLIVRSIETRAFSRYRLTAVPTNEGPDQWRQLVSLTYIDGDGIIADGEDVSVEWNRPGAQGTPGIDGTDGANGIFSAIASQAEAEAGADNTKGMTALRVVQSELARLATKAEMQAGTSLVKGVSPGLQHHHPSAAKAWALCDTNGGITPSYNVSGIIDGGAGVLSALWDIDFVSAAYVPFCTILFTPTGNAGGTRIAGPNGALTAGSVTFTCVNASTFLATDPAYWSVGAFGIQL